MGISEELWLFDSPGWVVVSNPGWDFRRRRWASSGWGYVKRGGSATVRVIILPVRHFPALPRPGMPAWAARGGGLRKGDALSDSPRASLALVRQHSMALQRRVVSSLDVVPGIYVILAPVLHPAMFLRTVRTSANSHARTPNGSMPNTRICTLAEAYISVFLVGPVTTQYSQSIYT